MSLQNKSSSVVSKIYNSVAFVLKLLLFIENFVLSPPSSYFFWGIVFYLSSRFFEKNSIFLGYLFFSYVISTPIVTEYLIEKMEQKYRIYSHENIAQAIVVLGSGLNHNAWEYGGVSVSTGELERLRHAAKLHRDTKLPILVTGGDPLQTGYKEAQFMKKTLEDEFNVPVKWVEDKSRTTKENLSLSGSILKSYNIKSVYLVTHAWHMKRTLSLANATNEILYIPSACSSDISQNRSNFIKFSNFVPSLNSINELKIIIHELGGEIVAI